MHERLLESRTTEEHRKLGRLELLRLLEPFQAIEDNVYTASQWPERTRCSLIRPDSVSDNPWCEVCSQDSCRCIETLFKAEFTAAPCGIKGRGLLAGVPGRGTLVFKKGDALGRLVGELLPPKSHFDGWAFDLDSDDGGTQVAQIYSRNKGNLFRLVDHDCGSCRSATVECQRISGIYAPIFYAARDLMDGDEITVFWGHNYLQGRQCFCNSCQERLVCHLSTVTLSVASAVTCLFPLTSG